MRTTTNPPRVVFYPCREGLGFRENPPRRPRGTRMRAVAIAALALSCARSVAAETREGSGSIARSLDRAGVGARSSGASRTAAYGARRRREVSARASSMSGTTHPAPIVVEPRNGAADSAFIMLHGLGDTGHGWAGAATQIPPRGAARVRWIFPTARTVPVTLNGGMRMTAWFDLNALDEASIVDDRKMIEESAAYVDALVREQIAQGIPSEKIVVGGFSQGGVIALTAALRSEVKLAGCVALSTYLALREDYPGKFGPHAKDTKILQGHGTHDMVLQYQYGKKSAEYLQSLGLSVDFKTYAGMQHSACAEEFDDLSDYLKTVLA